MRKLLQRGWQAFVAARQRRADAIVLEHLDARMLKDIGLEPWEGAGNARRTRPHGSRTWRAWRTALEPLGGFK